MSLRPPRRGWFVALQVMLGLLACMLMGGWFAWLGLVAGLVAGLGMRRPVQVGAAGLRRWRQSSAIALLLGGLVFWLGRSDFLVIFTMLCWLQVHRVWIASRARDDRITLLLALLMMLLASQRGSSVWLGLPFLGFMITMPLALQSCTLKESCGTRLRWRVQPPPDRVASGGLALASLVLTVLWFVVIPRSGAHGVAGLPQPDNRIIAFRNDVSLGAFGALMENPEVVMRFKVRSLSGEAVPGPFYLRGRALDHFDERSWSTRLPGSSRPVWSPEAPDPNLEVLIQEISLEPISDGILFGIPNIRSISGLSDPLVRDTNGNWHLEHDGITAIEYSVTSLRRPRDPTRLRKLSNQAVAHFSDRVEGAGHEVGWWLELPPSLDPRITTLAEQITGRAGPLASPYDKAVALETWLRSEFEYTRVPGAVDGEQLLSSFLFETQRGHCEFFATALAVMLRAVDIPSRVINGFYGGESNELGGYLLVRQQDAHSWVEAHLGEAGWVRFDGTPAARASPAPGVRAELVEGLGQHWRHLVLDYSQVEQRKLISALAAGVQELVDLARAPDTAAAPSWTGWGLLGLSLAGILGLGVLLRRALRTQWRARGGAVSRAHARARRLVARRGWRLPPSLPPLSAARWLEEQAGPPASPLVELAWLHYQVSYGRIADDALAGAAAHQLGKLAALPRAASGGKRGKEHSGPGTK